jgi:hypothetical protein
MLVEPVLSSEAEYRSLDIDSYSTLKVFIEDRRRYHRKFVLRDVIEEEESKYITFGSLVDCIKFTPEEVENRFSVSIAQPPTGQYGKFVDQLMKVTIQSINENGEVTRELEDMMLEAYNNIKFDRNGNVVDFKRDSFEVVKSKFVGTELELHYRQLRESYGKTIIEIGDIEKAQAVVMELNSNPVTREIMTCMNSERFTVLDQFPIIGTFELAGEDYPIKCLVDRIIIDHELRKIRIYDLKTVWDNEGEFMSNYFKYKYYIQAALYTYLVVQWKSGIDDICKYRVICPEFITAESGNYKSPLIYRTTIRNYLQGMNGFWIKGKYYPGVKKAISDLIWHKQTGIWNISKDAYENNGIIRVKPFI